MRSGHARSGHAEANRRMLRLASALALLGAVAACVPAPQPPVYAEATPMFERRAVIDVSFDPGTDRIRPGSYALLDTLAAALNSPELAGLEVEVNGHTALSGRLGYNIALSTLRAAEVADYLAVRGVAPWRIRAQGFGPLRPFDPGHPRSPANTRIEVVALR